MFFIGYSSMRTVHHAPHRSLVNFPSTQKALFPNSSCSNSLPSSSYTFRAKYSTIHVPSPSQRNYCTYQCSIIVMRTHVKPIWCEQFLILISQTLPGLILLTTSFCTIPFIHLLSTEGQAVSLRLRWPNTEIPPILEQVVSRYPKQSGPF